MLTFKFRVYIPAQHQMCNDVIAGHTYTACGRPAICQLGVLRHQSSTQDVVVETGLWT